MIEFEYTVDLQDQEDVDVTVVAEYIEAEPSDRLYPGCSASADIIAIYVAGSDVEIDIDDLASADEHERIHERALEEAESQMEGAEADYWEMRGDMDREIRAERKAGFSA